MHPNNTWQPWKTRPSRRRPRLYRGIGRHSLAGDMPQPLPYHGQIVRHLKAREQQLWAWFASHRVQAEHTEATRLSLLRSTYRVGRGTPGDSNLYKMADRAMEALGFKCAVTFYQAQNPAGLNASLAFIPHEAHIVLHGPITECLSETELMALVGHELTHFMFWTIWNGDCLVADQLLSAVANDESAQPAHQESERRFRLYTEILCDRGALRASQDLHSTVAALVKVETGVRSVCGRSYIDQANEVFESGAVRSDGGSHPESFIRARALALWQQLGTRSNDSVRDMIEGGLRLDGLDLLDQKRMVDLTRRLIDLLLLPDWMRTDATLGHASLYFDSYEVARGAVGRDDLAVATAGGDDRLKEYFCYIMCDFITSDPELRDHALAQAIVLARQIGLSQQLCRIVSKELGLTKRQWQEIDREAGQVVGDANRSRSPS